MNKNDYTALLTVDEISSKKRERNRLVKWLRNIADEIDSEDPMIFAKPTRFRLMK